MSWAIYSSCTWAWAGLNSWMRSGMNWRPHSLVLSQWSTGEPLYVCASHYPYSPSSIHSKHYDKSGPSSRLTVWVKFWQMSGGLHCHLTWRRILRCYDSMLCFNHKLQNSVWLKVTKNSHYSSFNLYIKKTHRPIKKWDNIFPPPCLMAAAGK